MGILERFLNRPPKPQPAEPVPVQEDVPVHVQEVIDTLVAEPTKAAVLLPNPAPPAGLIPIQPSNSQSVVKKPQSGPRQHTATRTPLNKVLDILKLHDDGALPSHIAEQVSADIRTVGAVLRQYRDRPASAKQLLMQATVSAAQAWTEAIPIAAARGNHGPAKELLLHAGVIEPAYGPGAARPTNVAVQVIIGTPDSPIQDDPVLVNPKPVK